MAELIGEVSRLQEGLCGGMRGWVGPRAGAGQVEGSGGGPREGKGEGDAVKPWRQGAATAFVRGASGA